MSLLARLVCRGGVVSYAATESTHGGVIRSLGSLHELLRQRVEARRAGTRFAPPLVGEEVEVEVQVEAGREWRRADVRKHQPDGRFL
eukprot:3739293-Prymnesium_polylepis.1